MQITNKPLKVIQLSLILLVFLPPLTGHPLATLDTDSTITAAAEAFPVRAHRTAQKESASTSAARNSSYGETVRASFARLQTIVSGLSRKQIWMFTVGLNLLGLGLYCLTKKLVLKIRR